MERCLAGMVVHSWAWHSSNTQRKLLLERGEKSLGAFLNQSQERRSHELPEIIVGPVDVLNESLASHEIDMGKAVTIELFNYP